MIKLGDKFGFWEVVSFEGVTPVCICTKCNQTKQKIPSYRLKNTAKCKDCSKSPNPIMMGNTYGYWKAVRKDSQRYHTICICVGCNSNVERSLKNNILKSLKSRSCGCKNKDLVEQAMQERYGGWQESRKKSKETCLKKYGTEHAASTLEVKERTKQSNLKKYGVEFFTQTKQHAEKKKETLLREYGVSYSSQIPEVRERVKQANLEKYGMENPSGHPQIREKVRQTNLERYGGHPARLEESKNKAKQTNLERYGVEYANQFLEIKNRTKQTNLERYGVEYALQSLEIQEKIKQSNLEKYGVQFTLKLPEIREKIKQTNLEKYGVENVYGSPEIREKIRQTHLSKYGVEYSLQNLEIQEKKRQTNLARYGVETTALLPKNRNRLRDWCDNNPDKLFTSFISKKELELLNWIKSYYPDARKMRKGGNEIDVFIPELNIGIEFNGLYWHSELNKPTNYHLDKTNYFKEHGIKLLHVFEHEWASKQQQIKSFLQSAINKNSNKIGARKCNFIWSNDKKDKKEVAEFLETYHIQGKVTCDYVVKVNYKDQLVAVATFGKHHRNSVDWVLSRFCTKQDYTIQGGLTKISKIAYEKLQSSIISWAHYRLSDGNGYKKAGWIEENFLPPDYFYHQRLKVVSKQSRQKKKVKTPEGMTEHEHALKDGLHRVYDCGKIRFRFKPTSN